MTGYTLAEIANLLGISAAAAKKRLQRAGITPTTYAGPTAIYAQEAIDSIRNVPGRGRPRTET